MARKPRASLSLPSRRRERSPTLSARTTDEIAGLQAVSDAVIYPHVFDNSDREVGGVLIGRTAADGGLPLLTGAIPAISADEQRATLTFTQEAWAHVHRVLESEFPPDEQIVGWYHSHPGFGIFLSGHDLFIHENFFSAPSQIAVVVDPRARTEGVFAWRDGELRQLFEHPTPNGWVATGPVQSVDETNAGTSRHAAVTPHGVATAHAAITPHGAVSPRGAITTHAAATTNDRYPLFTLVIAAIVGVTIGFGIWSIAEGGSGTSSTPTTRVTPTNVHRAKTAPTPRSNVQVLGQE
jgi:proteasome lid subunit RPN8/RPN11